MVRPVVERLKSRFGWGLTVAVEPPELETRVAILMKKADQAKVDLPHVRLAVLAQLRNVDETMAARVAKGLALDLPPRAAPASERGGRVQRAERAQRDARPLWVWPMVVGVVAAVAAIVRMDLRFTCVPSLETARRRLPRTPSR